MPSFDVVSQVDMQEVRNAVDQASREISNRFDFKGTESSIDLADTEITLHSNTEQKLKALVQVLEEKFVRRNVPLKALGYGKIQEASKGAAPPGGHAQRRDLRREGPGDQQVHQGRGAEGSPEPGPGRPAPGDREKARRPAGGHCRARKATTSTCPFSS